MTLYHAFEILVVALIVTACAVHVTGRYMPRTRERVKATLAVRLGGAAATGWRGWLARRLAPQAAAGCASGCETNSGCGTCGSNTSSAASAPPDNEQIIRFVRKS
ncbi:hypothetical protein D3C87_1261060 [compost metagenome]|jgi:hypothetical protein|uniref:Transmembrane protein n=1 Tax=Cupriavidus campinensis TaxID=151783 RepID=A0AAE9I620_9BURK|nr:MULTISPECIES: DUF6587 family protein [Cupriavidus]TSP10551.1 hypothetical protein FGG12_22510 [Cupriavidus campinensis]URF07145.1 hypothetical protein M5D45_18125 [Cupriavidus campinensis]CAG2148191.1 hypothetical protein LMG19282_03308 [Cupriavidus campinensis]